MNHLFGSGRRRVINLDELGTHTINQLRIEDISFSDGSASCTTVNSTKEIGADGVGHKGDENNPTFAKTKRRVAVVAPNLAMSHSASTWAEPNSALQLDPRPIVPQSTDRRKSYPMSLFPECGHGIQEAHFYDDIPVGELIPLVHRHGRHRTKRNAVACGLCRKFFPSQKVKVQLPCGHYLSLAECSSTSDHHPECRESTSEIGRPPTISNIQGRRLSARDSRCFKRCCPFFSFCIK